MNGVRLPLALSLAAHAIVLAALLRLPIPAPRLPPPISGGIEVGFARALPKPPIPAAAPPKKAAPVVLPPPPPVRAEPPPPPLPLPPPAPEAAVAVPEPLPLPPPPKPRVPVRRPPIQPAERSPARPVLAPPAAFSAAPAAPPAPTRQAALAPSRVPAPAAPVAVSPGYQALLGEWLNAHKRYPESAREHGEEGRAVLRFAVDRGGRVEQFAVVKSSGHADLDAAIAEMMRGATLPPFPADMPQPRVEVSVTIRFSLEH